MRNVSTWAIAAVLALSLCWLTSGVAEACHRCGRPCGVTYVQQYQLVQRTIYVPTTVMESRVVTRTICEPQVQERNITICRRVAETSTVMTTAAGIDRAGSRISSPRRRLSEPEAIRKGGWFGVIPINFPPLIKGG